MGNHGNDVVEMWRCNILDQPYFTFKGGPLEAEGLKEWGWRPTLSAAALQHLKDLPPVFPPKSIGNVFAIRPKHCSHQFCKAMHVHMGQEATAAKSNFKARFTMVEGPGETVGLKKTGGYGFHASRPVGYLARKYVAGFSTRCPDAWADYRRGPPTQNPLLSHNGCSTNKWKNKYLAQFSMFKNNDGSTYNWNQPRHFPAKTVLTLVDSLTSDAEWHVKSETNYFLLVNGDNLLAWDATNGFYLSYNNQPSCDDPKTTASTMSLACAGRPNSVQFLLS